MSRALHWQRTAAEHRAVYLQTYEAASRRLEELAQAQPPFSWAVVLDADETVIDNSTYQKEREALGEGYTRDSWYAWVARREATLLPGALEFLETARSLGGHIAIVTNRDAVVCLPTEDNLRALRVPFDAVLCRPMKGDRSKDARFAALQNGTATKHLPPLRILLWVGDNVGDFPGGSQALRDAPDAAFEPFGHRWFILPNPAYGSWEENPPR
jgi:5'-nucleotidase (lipoprotein e(P4) family)